VLIAQRFPVARSILICGQVITLPDVKPFGQIRLPAWQSQLAFVFCPLSLGQLGSPNVRRRATVRNSFEPYKSSNAWIILKVLSRKYTG